MSFLNFNKDNNDFNHYYDKNGNFINNPVGLNKEYAENDTQSFELNETSQAINIKIITIIFLYLAFLVLGMFNTTFKGYTPQIVNAKIKSQRVIFYKIEKDIYFLKHLENDFDLEEFQEVLKTKNFQEKVPPLQVTLRKINRKIDSLKERSYKVNEEDYLKIEMINIINDLLKTKAEIIKLAIQFYNTQSIDLQNQLIEKHNQYEIKYVDYSRRLEQIKHDNLYLFD